MWIPILTIVIMLMSLIWNVISEIRKDELNNKMDKLENNIIEKDSIIFELNEKLNKSDTLKI